MTDDRFDPRVLDRYEVPEPSPDLVDRFVMRLAQPGEPAATCERRWRWGRAAAGGALLVACTALVTLWLVRPTRTETPEAGEISLATRHEIQLPSAGVAVAEAGSQLKWHGDGHGVVLIEQSRGSVFYRLEPTRRFTVETAVTKVATTGTCFAVAIGSEADIVTVYEGSVLVISAGSTIRVAAGEQVRTTKAVKPERVARDVLPASVDDLRGRVAALQAEVARLSGSGAPEGGGNSLFDFNADQLAALARECDVPFDLPPLPGSTLMDHFLEESFDKTQFTDAERKAVMRVSDRWQPAFETELRGLFRELTGEAGDSLDPFTIVMEIVQKSTAAEILAAQQVVSRERAGLRSPPTDAKSGSIMERLFRLGIRAGDEFERALAREIPASRAREFRRTWGEINVGPGCPGGERAH